MVCSIIIWYAQIICASPTSSLNRVLPDSCLSSTPNNKLRTPRFSSAIFRATSVTYLGFCNFDNVYTLISRIGVCIFISSTCTHWNNANHHGQSQNKCQKPTENFIAFTFHSHYLVVKYHRLLVIFMLTSRDIDSRRAERAYRCKLFDE